MKKRIRKKKITKSLWRNGRCLQCKRKLNKKVKYHWMFHLCNSKCQKDLSASFEHLTDDLDDLPY